MENTVIEVEVPAHGVYAIYPKNVCTAALMDL